MNFKGNVSTIRYFFFKSNPRTVEIIHFNKTGLSQLI